MNRSSSVLTNILNRRSDLRADSDSDSPANSTGQMPFYDSESSSDDSCPPSSSRPACCLICSILPNLSSINSCPKHLSLLTSTAIAPNQVVYMMHPAVDGCYCPSRPSQRRKRSMTVESSSSEDEHFFSPTQLTKPSSPFNQNQAPLSPCLPPSSSIHHHRPQHNELLLTPLVNRTKRRRQHSDLPSNPCVISPRLLLDRVVLVKDDGEVVPNPDEHQPIMHMSEATEQMHNDACYQPKILLKRVCFEP